MIRNILITLIFFFGPALLMFVLRYFFLLFRWWLSMRRQAKQNQIIDITPHPTKTSPGRLFISVSVMIGLLCAVWIWFEMDKQAEPHVKYVPAYTDNNGQVVPGHYEPENRP
jgi:nicotinamide riboside transporter PnuC